MFTEKENYNKYDHPDSTIAFTHHTTVNSQTEPDSWPAKLDHKQMT